MLKNAAVIIIGNEILSGKTRDENSYYLAAELRGLGVELRLVMAVPDDIEAIAEAVRECSGKYDYVFTSGGIGPTHDDVTLRGVARAFGRATLPDEKLRAHIIKRCGGSASPTVLRMAELPEGAEVIELEGISFPPVRVENVYIFPGIPEFLKRKWEALRERFRDRPYHVRHFYINDDECFIAETLESLSREFGDVEIGSYPKPAETDYKVIVTIEGRDEGRLKEAEERLLLLLPPGIVVRRD